MSSEVAEEEVFSAFSKLIEDEKINWAELTNPNDLYTLCDKISAQFRGLPDSMLKTIMLAVLERNLALVDSEWLGAHLQTLITCWKREVASEKSFQRISQVVMEAPAYDPPQREQRKRKKKHRQNGRMMLSVGALLQSVTQGPSKTEEKPDPVNVEKSAEIVEIKNLTFEGNELSWDFWSKISNPASCPLPTTLKTTPKTPQMQHSDYRKWKKAQHEKRMGRKKLKIMDAARREMEEFDRQESILEDEGVETVEKENKREMEEGEIDSEEERLSKKRRQKEPRGSSESSSSESDVEGLNSRRRRFLIRRDKPRKNQLTAVFNNKLLAELYVFRHRLFKDLPLKQKKSLVRHFKEIIYNGAPK